MSAELQVQKWLDFYRPYFPAESALTDFVHTCAAQSGPNRPAKLIMHQVRRLIMLADQMSQLRPARDSLHIFWFVVCAEAASKLQAGYDRDDQSRFYVRRFFENFCAANDQNALTGGFQHPEDFHQMSLIEVVDTLYAVRCDVAHEGNYWNFTMASGIPMINVDQPAVVSLTLEGLRDIVVRAGIAAAESRLP